MTFIISCAGTFACQEKCFRFSVSSNCYFIQSILGQPKTWVNCKKLHNLLNWIVYYLFGKYAELSFYVIYLYLYLCVGGECGGGIML